MESTVFITGTSTGFGRAAAELLARRGHKVIATMRDPTGKNSAHRDALLKLAEREKLAIHVLELDVTSDESVDRAAAEAVSLVGNVDVLINNAGFACLGVTEAFTAEEFRELFETNFFGVIRVTRALLPVMRKQQRGLIIHVSSVAGRATGPYMAPYASSKFALEALAEAYRFELQPFGIDTVLVEPGVYPTAIFGKTFTPRDRTRAADYGQHDYSAQIAEGFQNMLANPELPGNHEVAEIFAKLIETPQGARPGRVLAGEMANRMFSTYNADFENLRQGMVERFGLDHLLPAATKKAAV